jgi:hypothetical protein
VISTTDSYGRILGFLDRTVRSRTKAKEFFCFVINTNSCIWSGTADNSRRVLKVVQCLGVHCNSHIHCHFVEELSSLIVDICMLLK